MNDDELRAAYQVWLESASVDEIPYPELETLERYLQKRLCPEERELVTKALCRYPELVRLLATDWRTPESGDIDIFSKGMVARRWSELQSHLSSTDPGEEASIDESMSKDLSIGDSEAFSAEAEGRSRDRFEDCKDSVEPILQEGIARRAVRVTRRSLETTLPASSEQARLDSLADYKGRGSAFWRRVSILVSLLAMIMGWQCADSRKDVARLESILRVPQVAPQHRVLVPDGFEDRFEASVEGTFPLGTASELLILNLRDLPSSPSYTVHILELDGAKESLVWSAGDLVPRPDRTIELWFPAQFWRGGRYRVDLYGRDSIEEKPLASFSLGNGSTPFGGDWAMPSDDSGTCCPEAL